MPIPPSTNPTTSTYQSERLSPDGTMEAACRTSATAAANASSINTAMLIPALCFAAVLLFALQSRRAATPETAAA